MAADGEFILHLRSQSLDRTPEGYSIWRVHESSRTVRASETAVLLCDVWDTHGCRAAVERLERMLPHMNRTVKAVREAGAMIVHAPSDTMDFYETHPARRRVLDAPRSEPPAERAHDDPPLPFDPTRDCCDTPGYDHQQSWSRQHAGIDIDPERDLISDSGQELCHAYAQRGIKRMLIMGVHTGMCILRRSFAIKQMVRWGFEVALIRDLTDALYNPALPPYVSHDEGTNLVIGYIEKFWCPTVLSEDIVEGRQSFLRMAATVERVILGSRSIARAK